jgi:hypothetical protein
MLENKSKVGQVRKSGVIQGAQTVKSFVGRPAHGLGNGQMLEFKEVTVTCEVTVT